MSLTDTGRAYGATTGNLKRLAVAVDENAATLPDVSVEKAALQSALNDADDAIRRQTFHTSQRQQATKDLKAALARGRDAGIRLQNAARFKLGTKDEKLLEFQLKPQRKRQSPLVKRATDAEEKAAGLEQEIEQLKELQGSPKDEMKGDKTA